jgi:hypothetical protein
MNEYQRMIRVRYSNMSAQGTFSSDHTGSVCARISQPICSDLAYLWTQQRIMSHIQALKKAAWAHVDDIFNRCCVSDVGTQEIKLVTTDF